MIHCDRSYSNVPVPKSVRSNQAISTGYASSESANSTIGNDNCIEIPTENRSKFDVNVEVGPEKTKVFLATVDLGKLGMKVGWQAKRGKIPSIYVLGHVPDENDSDGEA